MREWVHFHLHSSTRMSMEEYQTDHAAEQYKESLQRWPKSLLHAHRRSLKFKSLKETLTKENCSAELKTQFSKLAEFEHELEPLLRDATDVEKESYDQVCWTTTPWTGLNALPFALVILSIYKSYIVPTISILVPLLSWVLPYVFLRTFYNIPIQFTDYCRLLWRMWNGHGMPRNPQDLMNPLPEPTEPPNILAQLKQWGQNGWTLFTLGQAFYEPIKQAKHFRTLDSNCLDLGKAVLEVRDLAHRLYTRWKEWMAPWLEQWIQSCPLTDRQAFAHCLEFPYWLKHLFRSLGQFEVLSTLALRSDTTPVQFVKSQTPILMLEEFGDPKIPVDQRVLSSIRLGGKGVPNHAVLTGPNRGGKSSLLRGLQMNVEYAHCFGCVFAKKGQVSYFTWIANALQLEDTPGSVSMFEKEVQFASGITHETRPGGLVLYDELFHSTNPPDATRASSLFCSRLWGKSNCLSVVSTHIYSLAASAPPDYVKQVCVAAWRTEKGYVFSYKAQKGICTVSSVDLLLQQYKLLV